jgi:dTDP-D-glucose 4,6-dehydratase
MLTTVEVAQQLSEHFLKATYKEHAANHILIEINSLCYTESKQPLEFVMKAAIIQLIEEHLSDTKYLKTFQQYKPSLLKKLNGEIHQQKERDKKEYIGVLQFKGLLSHVFH